MSIELLETLSLVSYVMAAILGVVAIILFFILEIPKLYGDVSGRTARKAIENIRLENTNTGNKAYKPSKVNAERGRLTDKITETGRILASTEGIAVHVGTEKFNTNTLNTDISNSQINETTVLYETGNETTVLMQEDSTSNETAILWQDEQTYQNSNIVNQQVELLFEISFAESQEIIE